VITIIVLDTGPLGLLAHPKASATATWCVDWLAQVLMAGARVVVPAVADYELRRKLLHIRSQESILILDRLIETLDYLAIDRQSVRIAAELWARARFEGRPTAPDLALDADCLLAALAESSAERLDWPGTSGRPETRTVVATTNPKHLRRYVPAEEWSSIKVV
jgi:predicted nucleic acid-binding protein